MRAGYRIHGVRVLTRRELRSTLLGPGLYVVLTLVFLAVSHFAIGNSLFNVRENGLMVFPNPINRPFFLAMGLVAGYLGLCSAVAISRERDLGTLEVLFYGPVDAVSYVAAKFLQQMAVFLVALVFSLAYFVVVSGVTNLGFSRNFPGLLILSVFLAASIVSFGIFLSAATRRVLASVVLFLGAMLFFLAFSVAHTLVMGLSGREITDLVAYLRVLLEGLDAGLRWVSPLAYFGRGLAASEVQDPGQYLLSLVSSAVYSLVLLGLSVYLFRRKGVRR